MASLIGVHGVRNYRGDDTGRAAVELASIWRHALGEGPLGKGIDGVSLSAAYYAHLLRDKGQAADGSIDDLPPDAEEMARAWLDQWDLDPGISQGIGTMPLRQAIGILATHLGLAQAAVEAFVAVFFREVACYLRGNAPHRTRARADVATAISAAASPRIVIAHSLGSVVTYEALTAYPDVTVELLVTVGSPLALPGAVFDRLDPLPRNGSGERPAGVKSWVNLTDRGDLIAIPPGGVKARFLGVDRDCETSIHWADFHLAANYLRTDALAEILRPYLA